MKLLPYIRLVSYVIVAAAFYLVGRQTRVIPVTLVGGDYAYTHDQKRKIQSANMTVPRTIGFEHTTKSGSEVIAIAKRAAEKSGANLTSYGPPQVSLKEADGRLEWLVAFYLKEPVPGGFFTVTVDDQSGATEITGGI